MAAALQMTPLYEALLERDVAAIPATVRAYRDEHGSEETFKAIGRFAVLAYSPSQHGKHAVLACLAAWDLREEPYFDDVVTQCAIYAAEGRQPWSEPPIMTPPALDDDQRGDLAELLEAIAASDRLRGERWLAKRFDDDDLSRDYFAAAADDFDDLGHKLIVADAAWRLVPILGEQGRFAALRLGIWEMTAYHGDEHYEERGEALDAETLFARLVDNFVSARGDIVAAHELFLFDAALGKPVEQRVRDYLTKGTGDRGQGTGEGRGSPVPRPLSPVPYPVYKLSRDYAEYLKMHALAKRHPHPALLAAARANLDHAHFDELSFA
jgi:hypothetical protein